MLLNEAKESYTKTKSGKFEYALQRRGNAQDEYLVKRIKKTSWPKEEEMAEELGGSSYLSGSYLSQVNNKVDQVIFRLHKD
jgi:hypothetical protein